MSIGSFKTKAEAEPRSPAAVSAHQLGGWVAPEMGRVILEDYAWQCLDTVASIRWCKGRRA